MKTASWFTKLPADHLMIGISRGVPRGLPAGYRLFRALAPGPWFNSVTEAEYLRRYRTEILDRLDPLETAARLVQLASDRIPVLACYERPDGPKWCHRSVAARWLSEALHEPVPEFGYEHLQQHEHPLQPPSWRRG